MPKADPEKLVKFIVESIIGEKNKFTIKREEGSEQILLELTLPKDETGKIVGKGGTTIWSIRKLAGVAGVNLAKKVLVNLAE